MNVYAKVYNNINISVIIISFISILERQIFYQIILNVKIIMINLQSTLVSLETIATADVQIELT